MIPTPRLLLLLLSAAMPIALASVWPATLVVLPGWLLLAFVLLLLDVRVTASPSVLQARRFHAPRLSLGVPNLIRLEVLNTSRRTLRLWVRDEFPTGMLADAHVLFANPSPNAPAVLLYRVIPPERGEFRFGAINVRYMSALGLFLRQVAFKTEDAVRVYPNLLELRKYDLLARRGALEEAGLRQARLRGMGTDFERLREYTPDDDYRRIHWKATARRGKPISIEFETERSQNLVILLDASRLMAAEADEVGLGEGSGVGELASGRAGEAPLSHRGRRADGNEEVRMTTAGLARSRQRLTKLDYALNAALMTAYVANQRGDRVAMLAFADRLLAYVPPSRGRKTFSQMLEALYKVQAQQVEPDFGLTFTELTRRHQKRSLLLLFTDLAEPKASAGLLAHLARASRRHLVVCVTIQDPLLAAAAAQPAASSRALYERTVAQRLLDERQQLLGGLRHRGVVTLDVRADQLTPAVVNTYLETKARTRL